MNSNLLKIFIEVANKKSVSKAAKSINSAQSNVTSRIQQLEKSLDCKLFHRIPSGVILTKEGEKLYIHALEITKRIEIATLDMKNLLVEQKLIVGSTESNALIRIVDFLVIIHKDFPQIQLKLITNTTDDIKQLLLDYKIDIGFISGIPDMDEFEVLNIIDERLVLVEPKQIDIPDVYISFKKGCAYNDFSEKFFNKDIDKKFTKLEFGSYETILGCVEAGMGKAILPFSIIQKYNYESRVNIVTLPKDISYMPTCLICRKDNFPKISEYLKSFNF